MKKQFVLLVIMLSFCLQGCVVYNPRLGKKIMFQGARTSRGEIDNFLVIGKTSKAEIHEAWDNPAINMQNRNIWMYDLLIETGNWFMIYPVQWASDTKYRNAILLVKFDDYDYVKYYELKKLPKSITHDEMIQKTLEWDNSFEVQSK